MMSKPTECHINDLELHLLSRARELLFLSWCLEPLIVLCLSQTIQQKIHESF